MESLGSRRLPGLSAIVVRTVKETNRPTDADKRTRAALRDPIQRRVRQDANSQGQRYVNESSKIHGAMNLMARHLTLAFDAA